MSLQIRNVRKVFGATPVLDNLSLSVEAREFIAFLGPSGSGKSTLLRIIAGLETADAGEIWLEDRRIDGLPPGERGVAMVFQHYALYPHMTVRENMAFGLRNARVPKDEIESRVTDAARVLEIEVHLDKKPGQLSGGQRQRVAIGRAIVKQPKLFMLDEPLSNLDAALRMRTRVELAQLRQKVDAAVIMVTHDQAEAMTLADRIVVMNDRTIQQVGPPMEIYERPANVFVAQFVGSPAMTLLPARLTEDDGQNATLRLGDGAESSGSGCAPKMSASPGGANRRPRRRSNWSSGSASARSFMLAWPTGRALPPRMKATAGSGSATRSAFGSTETPAIFSERMA